MADGGYIMHASDIKMTVMPWLAQVTEDIASQMAVWHTHPKGSIGPSKGDMEQRKQMPETAYLVVAFTEQGPIPNWF